VCSPTNVVLYLFKLMKYIHKGGDVNRLQLVADGKEAHGRQGSADGSTHRRDERRDEIRDWRNAKTTCAPQAYRRIAGHTTYVQEPPCEQAHVHEPRRRDPRNKKDIGLSEWEQYLARPRLPELTDLKFEEFLRFWRCGTEATKPKDAMRHLPSAASLKHDAEYFTKAGLTVYNMNESGHQLREGTVNLTKYMYWKRDAADAADRAVRLLYVPKSAGVRYFVRMLGKHVAARSYEDLRRDALNPLLIHESFEVACRKRGLLEEETEARDVVLGAVEAGDSGAQLRSLIAQLLKEGFPLAEALDDDMLLRAASADLSDDRAAAFADIDDRLAWLGSSLATYAPRHGSAEPVNEVARERRVYEDRAAQRALADGPALQLDTQSGPAEQSEAVRWALCGARLPGEPEATPEALAGLEARAPAALEVGVLCGDGGAGKTRTVKRLAAEVRARGRIQLNTAATNLAATNYDRGMSTHALGLLAGDGEDDEGNVTIKLKPAGRMTPERLALLKAAHVIVIDEFSNLHCAIIDALVRFLREHGCTARVLLVGDPQQIPPVLPGASRDEVIEASVVLWPQYRALQHLPLTKAYRQHCAAWAALVRSVGAGTAVTLTSHALTSEGKEQRAIALTLVRRVHHEDAPGAEQRALEELFGVDAQGHLDVHGGGFRAVLCARNDRKNAWNALVNERRERETGDAGRTYVATHRSTIDHGGDEGDALAAEALGEDDMAMFQNKDHSVPLGELTLRVGDIMLLAKTLDKARARARAACTTLPRSTHIPQPAQPRPLPLPPHAQAAGLVKNARVVVMELRWNAATVRLDRTDAPSSLHTIGRAIFAFKLKRSSPLKIVRKQLPLVHAWALTINRSQGQTLDRVLLDLRDAAFEHGQAYVAVSRVHTADELAVFVNDSCVVDAEDGTRVGVLACITYERLLREAAPASAAASNAHAGAGRKRARPTLTGLLALNSGDEAPAGSRGDAARARKRRAPPPTPALPQQLPTPPEIGSGLGPPRPPLPPPPPPQARPAPLPPPLHESPLERHGPPAEAEPDYLEEMLGQIDERRAEDERMAVRVDGDVDTLFDNGVRINPVLATLYG